MAKPKAKVKAKARAKNEHKSAYQAAAAAWTGTADEWRKSDERRKLLLEMPEQEVKRRRFSKLIEELRR